MVQPVTCPRMTHPHASHLAPAATTRLPSPPLCSDDPPALNTLCSYSHGLNSHAHQNASPHPHLPSPAMPHLPPPLSAATASDLAAMCPRMPHLPLPLPAATASDSAAMCPRMRPISLLASTARPRPSASSCACRCLPRHVSASWCADLAAARQASDSAASWTATVSEEETSMCRCWAWQWGGEEETSVCRWWAWSRGGGGAVARGLGASMVMWGVGDSGGGGGVLLLLPPPLPVGFCAWHRAHRQSE